MNILVIGSGGREHVLADKIKQSKKCSQLFIAPGNAGTDALGKNVAISPTDFAGLAKLCLDENIKLVVVGPEAPLVEGIRDYFEADEQLQEIKIIGPGKAGAQLEGSKDFSKDFMHRHNIPTAAHRTFTKDQLAEGLKYLETLTAPFVLKADGLAAGKGVIISSTLEEAQTALTEMLADAKFGDASSKVVIEEFLSGIELSVFVLTDGENYKILPEAKDYKRIGEKDTGLNTGGMGAVSPVLFADSAFMNKVEEIIVKPTVNGLKADNIPYQGFIFIGLMNVNGTPYVIEYNVRMGDPETQVVLPRVKNDFVTLFSAVADQKLNEVDLLIDEQTASTVVLVAGGYPEAYEKGKEISGLSTSTRYFTYHAGTTLEEGKTVTSGGRVLAITGFGENLQEALDHSYEGVEQVTWEQMYFRKDIGQDLLALSSD